MILPKFLYTLIQDKILLAPLVAFIITQFLKGILASFKEKNILLNRFFESGGMPSSHSAMVTALAISAGVTYGWSSALFTIVIIFSVIVMYDAMGVRRAAGNQAKVLNQVMKELSCQGHAMEVKVLQEFIGHTPLEVVVGLIIGLTVAAVVF